MTYHRPKGLEDALDLLQAAPMALLAGGTDIYPATEFPTLKGDVLDLTAIPTLRGISQSAEGWRIGATTTWSEIIKTPLPQAFAALQQAGREVGSVQIQNRGTLAGNLCNASPAADGVPPLLVLDAMVELRAKDGIRVMPLAEFIAGPRQTKLAPGEMLAAVLIPAEAATGRSVFSKLGARKYLVISIAMSALRLTFRGDKIETAAIATGSCGPVARRLSGLENALTGLTLDAAQDLDIATLISDDLTPISDIRARADYRIKAAAQQISDVLNGWPT